MNKHTFRLVNMVNMVNIGHYDKSTYILKMYFTVSCKNNFGVLAVESSEQLWSPQRVKKSGEQVIDMLQSCFCKVKYYKIFWNRNK